MEKIWWEQVPNACSLATEVINNITNEKNTVLVSKCGLPWYDYFYEKLKEKFRQSTASKSIEELSDICNPGEYLLKKYCKPEKQAAYRPNKSFAKFLADSDDIVFHDRFFWVNLCDEALVDCWINFVSEYCNARKSGEKQAVFLIECLTDRIIVNRKGTTVISFDDYISGYDRFVFCMLAASSVSEKSLMKKYLSELSSNVIGNNIELCAKVIDNYRSFLSAPYCAIHSVIDSQRNDDGTVIGFNKTEEEVQRDVWLAQVRVVYPVLEDYRKMFVKRHREDVKMCLPISSSSGEEYTAPEDVELGTLRFLAANRKIVITNHERSVLDLHTEARNKLSHLKTLGLSEVRRIFDCIAKQ